MIICGTGNNGADGLVIGEKLYHYGYEVKCVIIQPKAGGSPDFNHHLDRLSGQSTFEIGLIRRLEELPPLDGYVVIDALFGSGLSRPLEGIYAQVVDRINKVPLPVYAVDCPSGLPGEDIPQGAAVRATACCCFEFPRRSFFTREGRAYTGDWNCRSINLSKHHIETTPSNQFMIDQAMACALLKRRKSFSHKGDYGHVHLVVSQKGMAGAGILAARAAIRSGCGLCSISTSVVNRSIFQSAVPEAMVRSDFESMVLKVTEKDTLAIGPGIGKDAAMQSYFAAILEQSNRPAVIDADGINILAENRSLYRHIPPRSILTPHPKEFSRLADPSEDSFDRLRCQQAFSKVHNVILVLKDHHTCITDPQGNVFYNSTGNPGMATGGSGDVLTGIIGAFLAQSYEPLNAAILGVYIHGLAGDLYSKMHSQLSLTATDLVDHISGALNHLSKI